MPASRPNRAGVNQIASLDPHRSHLCMYPSPGSAVVPPKIQRKVENAVAVCPVEKSWPGIISRSTADGAGVSAFPLGLTYDDVLLVPRRSRIASRRDVDTTTQITRELTLAIPIVSANMDTVTEYAMAVGMAREGGLGVIHRFMSIEEEAAQIARVKRPEEYVIREVHTITPDRTLREASTLMTRFDVTSLLVVDGQ